MAADQIVFLTNLEGDPCALAVSYLGGSSCEVARNLDDLFESKATRLVSFGTSVIVPSLILENFVNGAFNFHSASPDFPGRDPHNWAVYEGVARYGATLHKMTPRVDDGQIIDVEWFDVEVNTSPRRLLLAANEASFRLLQKFGPLLSQGLDLEPRLEFCWGGKKRGRRDLLAICRIDSSISEEEFVRRLQAFNSDDYNNLHIGLHGKVFRIEPH